MNASVKIRPNGMISSRFSLYSLRRSTTKIFLIATLEDPNPSNMLNASVPTEKFSSKSLIGNPRHLK